VLRSTAGGAGSGGGAAIALATGLEGAARDAVAASWTIGRQDGCVWSRCYTLCERGRSVVSPWVWPGVRRAGLPRQSPALTPGQRRRRRRLDQIRLNSANAAQVHSAGARVEPCRGAGLSGARRVQAVVLTTARRPRRGDCVGREPCPSGSKCTTALGQQDHLLRSSGQCVRDSA